MKNWLEQKNIILDNVFTDSQIIAIKKIVASKKPDLFEPQHGRYLIGLDNMLSEDIKDRLLSLAKECTGEDLILSNLGYSLYSPEYGTPELKPHIDGNDTEFVIDYQLSSNVDWDVYVEGERYSLKDNQAITFAGSDQIHWRPIKKFNSGDRLEMIYFHMITKDHWSLTGGENPKISSEWRQKQNESFDKYKNDWLKTEE